VHLKEDIKNMTNDPLVAESESEHAGNKIEFK